MRKAYPSLFEYLVQEIGYSAGAAQRRIDAARLLQRVPEVSRQIETGAIHLSQISKMQKICRQIKKESGQSVEPSVQKDVLQKLENQNSAQTDLILAREFQVEIKVDEKKVTQRDESVRVELTFTKDEMALMKKAQELLSTKTGGAFKSTLLEMAQRTINSYKPKSACKREAARKSACESTSEATDGAAVAVKNSLAAEKPTTQKARTDLKLTPPKSVTPKLKREILHRDQFCQFKDAATGKVCGTKLFLEFDHIRNKDKKSQFS